MFLGINPQDSEHDIIKLITQLQKKQWKIMVNDVKLRLAHAQQANDAEGIRRALADFQSLKQMMLQKGLL